MEKKKKKGFKPREQESREFDQRVIDLARVTRVMAGGKRLRFRACVAVGDKKGRVGVAMGKGADVSLAVNKAVARAKKNLISIPIARETIPHMIRKKSGAAVVLLKPAPIGTGIRAGGVVRLILELGGVPNVVAKILGSNNKINNARALVQALDSFIVRERRNTVNKSARKKEEPAESAAL